MNISLKEKLIQAGLSEKEACIYSFLVETGGAFPSDIAENTKINRSTVYKILITLAVQGLVSEVEKKKKLFYYPTSPTKFLRHAKQRISVAEDAYEKAQKIMPELEGLFRAVDSKPKVTFYEGKEQVLQAYMTQVEEKGGYELVSFASTNHLEEFLPPKMFREYIMLKNKHNITARGLVPDTPHNKKFLERTHEFVRPHINPVIRYVPEHIFPFAGEIVMYQTKRVLMVKFDTKNPIAIIIEDKMIHDMMKMIFELSWAGSKNLK